MSENNKKIFEDIFKNGIVLIFSFLISSGLLGGSGYILFESEKEWQKLSEFPTRLAEENKDAQPYLDMDNVIGNGWFMNEQNMKSFGSVIDYLSLVQSRPTLDKEFVSNTIFWIDNSESQLRKERGIISGYNFEDDLLTKHQQSTLDLYDLQITENNQIRSMINNWETMSPEQRNQEYQILVGYMAKVLEKLPALTTESSQIIEQTKLKQAKLDDDYNEVIAQYNSYQRRVNASIAGIIIGFIALSFSLWSGYKYYLASDEKTDKKSKSTKSKSK